MIKLIRLLLTIFLVLCHFINLTFHEPTNLNELNVFTGKDCKAGNLTRTSGL